MSPMHYLRMIIVLLIVLVPGQAKAEDTARAAYDAYGCYQCHGFIGQGGAAGPQLAPRPLPFEAFAEIVRQPPNRMPAYSPDVLSEQTLSLIYDYVQSIELPPAKQDIPLLQNLEVQ